MSDRDAPALSFDGRRVPFRPGQTVGAALMAEGIASWRTTRREHGERGLFCGIGVCFDCLVTVDGDRVQRACMTPACDGQVVESEHPDTPVPHAADARAVLEEHDERPAR